MTDPVFAAEMASIAAARRDRERGRTGDGMAVEAPHFMDFSGPRVPVPPSRETTGTVTSLRSEFHSHADAPDCLETVEGGIYISGRAPDVEIPESGWVMCTRNNVRYHLHNGHLMAHWSRDRAACPDGVA